jgi:hypothetical protein
MNSHLGVAKPDMGGGGICYADVLGGQTAAIVPKMGAGGFIRGMVANVAMDMITDTQGDRGVDRSISNLGDQLVEEQPQLTQIYLTVRIHAQHEQGNQPVFVSMCYKYWV